MLRLGHIARTDKAAIARKLTAMLLVLAIVSAFAPLASLASAHSHSSMDCCADASHHHDGTSCTGHSCHSPHAPAHAAAATTSKAGKPAPEQSDPLCGASARQTSAPKQSAGRSASHHAAHALKHQTAHASPQHDSQPRQHVSPARTAQHTTQHTAHASSHSSSHASSQKAAAAPLDSAEHQHSAADSQEHEQHRHQRAVAASVSKPCPPECGTCAVSFTNRTPRREHVITANAIAPRASTPAVFAHHSLNPSSVSDAKRRQTRPRAPPSSLVR